MRSRRSGASRRPLRAQAALAIAASACLAFAPLCRTEIHPLRGRGDARIRTARYDADEVYRIHGFVGYQIDLEFAPDERFVGLAAGDIDALSFVARDNHLFIKPRAVSVGTNLTIITNRHEYQLDYTATAQIPDESDPDLIYALKFQYGESAQSPAENNRRDVEERLRAASVQRTRNLDYWYCGAPSLRPVSAWDDGVHTHLRFGAHAELPALFLANEDGSESLLNFDVQADEVVIHRIARRFVLRRGALTGCIVNRGFVGSGERLDSGTIAPDVARVRKGAEQ